MRSPASAFALALLDALIARGVRHVVLAPGSRSQALALAAAAAERRGDIALHVRIDERVAGFVALGIARETRMPAAVICTSGTAVANLHPAVLEAHHAAVPMLVLTADRPPELRGIGASQTTAQPGIYGDAVRLALDVETPGDQTVDADALAERVVDAALGCPMGPVHVNLPMREPLSDAGSLDAHEHVPSAEPSRRGATHGTPTRLEAEPRTVVIAGADAGAGAEKLACAAGLPLIAEISSGSRFGRALVSDYRGALQRAELGGRVERAIVFGHPTLSREVTALVSRPDVDVIAVQGPGEALNLNGRTRHVASVEIDGPGSADWAREWMRWSLAARRDLDPPAPDVRGLHSADPRERKQAAASELAAVRTPLDREHLVAAVWHATWPHDRLVFGSSRLVRVADHVLGGKNVRVHANRGLAGIDGTISTAVGIAAAADNPATVVRVVLGDLALLHDTGGLLIPPDEASARLQVIVGNDHGGTIFSLLEVAETARADDFQRVMLTPQHVDIEHLAEAYGWTSRRVTTRSALDQALTDSSSRRTVIEVPLSAGRDG